MLRVFVETLIKQRFLSTIEAYFLPVSTTNFAITTLHNRAPRSPLHPHPQLYVCVRKMPHNRRRLLGFKFLYYIVGFEDGGCRTCIELYYLL